MVNTPLVEKMTNPICRASYLGHIPMVAMLLKYGADVNLPSSEGNTPLMWAAFRNNYKLTQFLLENGADIALESHDGNNAMDMAVIRMSYEVARLLRKNGLAPKGLDDYHYKIWRPYDLDLFMQCLEDDVESVEPDQFFVRIIQ